MYVDMSSIWPKILSLIDERNLVLRAKGITIDIEVRNLSSLLADLKLLSWELLNEWKLNVSALQETIEISAELPSQNVGRKRNHRRVDSDNGDEGEQDIDE